MLRKRKLIIYATALLAISILTTESSAQQRGPSTPEERTRAVQISKSLRANPFGANSQDREWLVKWLIEIPDISVKLCSGLLGDLGDSKSGYPEAMLATMMASEAAFVIENADKAKDPKAVYTAGLEGVLDAYKVIHEKDSTYRLPQLDGLLQERTEEKLVNYVRTATKKCK